MKRCILYGRVSSDDRKREGLGLAGQIEMGRKYAHQHRYHVVAELTEDERGVSGADWNPPQLTQALDMAQAGEFDVLVVRELDRLARDLAKQLFVEYEFKRAGVAIEYVLGEYPDTPEGNLLKNVRAVIAEYERLKISERTKRGRRRKIEAGHVSVGQGQAPYGYQNAVTEDGKNALEICQDEARVIRQIFQWYAGRERLSLSAIASRLSALGTPTWRDLRTPGRGKSRPFGWWDRSRVRDILRNEVYTGVWRFGKRKTVQVEGRLQKVYNPTDHLIPVPVPAEFAHLAEQAEHNFEMRLEAIEVADVRGWLAIEDGEKVVHVSCVLGNEVLYPELVSKSKGQLNVEGLVLRDVLSLEPGRVYAC